MKKFLILLIIMLSFAHAFGLEISLMHEGKEQKHIDEIAFRILNANKIEKRMNFFYQGERKIANSWTSISDRQITITRGILAYIDNDDEMAALLSHEIAHAVESYNGIFRGYFHFLKSLFIPKRFEINADKKAVDYMVKAGYNPVAMIILLNKISGQARYDWYLAHPLTSKRMMIIYEYIYKKYPAYLINNKYMDNIYYQNFLLTSQTNRQKLKQAIEINDKRKIKYE